jgi:hypothetical protein
MVLITFGSNVNNKTELKVGVEYCKKEAIACPVYQGEHNSLSF